MSWNERQRRMLAAMGVRLWSPAPAATPPVAADASVATAVAERPVEAPAAAPAARVPEVEAARSPAAPPVRAPALADRKSVV